MPDIFIPPACKAPSCVITLAPHQARSTTHSQLSSFLTGSIDMTNQARISLDSVQVVHFACLLFECHEPHRAEHACLRTVDGPFSSNKPARIYLASWSCSPVITPSDVLSFACVRSTTRRCQAELKSSRRSRASREGYTYVRPQQRTFVRSGDFRASGP